MLITIALYVNLVLLVCGAVFSVCREFIICCGRALEINGQLIKLDQKMYQEDLNEKYSCLKSELVTYVGESDDEVRIMLLLLLLLLLLLTVAETVDCG